MTLKTKMSVLAGAVSALMFASQANAVFNYDLRFAPAGNPKAPSADLHSVTIPVTGVYHLELWAQITGNNVLTDDVWLSGFFSITSGTSSSNAITGALLNPAYASTWPGAQTQTGALADLNADGIGDWGSTNSSLPTAWNLWQNTSGVPGGGAVGHQVNATTWEILVGTVDVNVASVTGATTTFNVVVAPAGQGSFAYSGIGKSKPVQAGIDSAANNITTTNQVTVGPGVTFINVPEPASLAMLGLGGLALLARRRK